MSLIIKNLDTVDIALDDLGLTLPASSTLDLISEEAGDVASSATGGDLDTEISALRVAVLDPLDDTTQLNVANSLEALRRHNDAQYRIQAGSLHQLDDVTITQAGSPLTSSPDINDILQFNGSVWTNIPGDDIGDVDREHLRFVGKHGDDSNDGRTPAKAFLTFGAAVAAVNSGSPVPSSTDRYAILCQDAGTYAESFTAPGWVTIEARSAKIEGTITLEDNCEVNVGEVEAAVNNSTIQKLDGTAVSRVDADTLRATGTGNTILNGSGSPPDTSIIILKARQVFVEDGVGVLDNSTSPSGHIHVDIEDLYVTGTGSGLDRNSNTGFIVGRVSHILEIDGGIGNGTAIEVNSGQVDIVAGLIDATTAYSVDGPGTLKVIVNRLLGTRTHTSGSATVDVLEADVLRWISIDDTDSPFDPRRLGFYSVNTSSGPVTLRLPYPPSDGDNISFQDALNSFETNNLTVDANGSSIEIGIGSPSTVPSVDLDVNGTSGVFIYNAAIGAWTFSRIQEEVAFSPDNVIYVTKNGDDITGDGSFSNPFLTVKKGASVALSVASASNPTTVKVLDGIYDEVNPISLTGATSRYVTIQGSQEQSTIIRPNVNGSPLFDMSSSFAFDGPTLSRMTLQGKANGPGSPLVDYKDVAGGALMRVSGDGIFFTDKVIFKNGYQAIDAGNGAITGEQQVVLSFTTVDRNTVAIDAKTDGTRVIGQVVFFHDNDTAILTADSARVELGNFEIAESSTAAIDNNDSATVFMNSGYIRDSGTAISGSGTSTTTGSSIYFEDNTTDLDQVDGTANIQLQGFISKTKQLITNGENVSLNYINQDDGDYIVGNADATGDPGKEFRVRDVDGRVAIGDNATDENIATGTVGASRSVNLIDENGNFRIWRFTSAAGEDPAIEWIKGVNPSLPDDVGDTPIVSITAATGTIVIDVSGTDYNGPFDTPYGINRLTLAERAFPAGREIRVNGTAANDGDYVVTSATYTGGSPDPETIEIVIAGSPSGLIDAGTAGEVVWGGGAGRPDGVSTYVGDPGAAVAAGVGNVRWDMFLQEDDYFVIRRRTDGGGSAPNEKVRVYPDHSEWLGATDYDDGDNATILYLQTVAGADNYLEIDNATTGNGPEIQAQGTDTDVDIELVPKGTGTVTVPTGYESNINAAGDVLNLGYLTTNLSQFFQHNGATTQTYTATTTILFPTVVRADSDYTYSAGEVTINRDGWYEITYELTVDNGGGGRRTGTHTLEVNATPVAGSVSNTYHRNATDGRSTATVTVLLNLTNGDIVRVRSSGNASITTVADGCRLRIEGKL